MFHCSYAQLVCHPFSFERYLFLFVVVTVCSAPTQVLAHNASAITLNGSSLPVERQVPLDLLFCYKFYLEEASEELWGCYDVAYHKSSILDTWSPLFQSLSSLWFNPKLFHQERGFGASANSDGVDKSARMRCGVESLAVRTLDTLEVQKNPQTQVLSF